MSIEERIQRLEDIEAIRYLQAKYQRCLDARDFNGVSSCFTESVESAYGNGEMSFRGWDAVIGFLMKSMTLDMPSAHMIHGGEIDIIDTQNAKAKWYLQDVLLNKTHKVNIQGVAIYDVEYFRPTVNDSWKISKIGYTRGFEYKDMASQTQQATLGKTTFVDNVLNGSVMDFTDLNRVYKEMSEEKK